MGSTTKSKDCIAAITAGGDSAGIPRMNVRSLGGIPLVARTIRAAQAARSIGAVIVSTDDDEIAAIARREGAEVIRRPAELAGPLSSSESALLHALDELDKEKRAPRYMAWLQCASPLTTPEDIDGTLALVASGQYDAAVTATEFHRFIWKQDAAENWIGVNHDAARRPMRQERGREVMEVGAVYALNCEQFRRARYRFFGRIGMYSIPVWRSFEIDEPDDWPLAEALVRALAPDQPRVEQLDLAAVRAVVTDFDGVLTDNRVYVNSDGVESVACTRADGWGIHLLREAGIPVACLSTEENPVVTRRCEKIGIPCKQGLRDKRSGLEQFCKEANLSPANVLFIGNDTNDAACLELAGVAVVPADAAPEILPLADARTQARGGEGVLREVASAIIGQRSARR